MQQFPPGDQLIVGFNSPTPIGENTKQISLILLWGLDPWPLDPLDHAKLFEDVSFVFKEK